MRSNSASTSRGSFSLKFLAILGLLIASTPEIAIAETSIKPVLFKVMGETQFEYEPDSDLRVGKKISSSFQNALVKYSCPTRYPQTNVSVLGASGKTLSSSQLKLLPKIKKSSWTVDKYQEDVFRIEVICQMTSTLKLEKSGFYIFKVGIGKNTVDATSPRFDLPTLSGNKWNVTYFPIPELGRNGEGHSWFTPKRSMPIPLLEVKNLNVKEGIRTVQILLTNSIYTIGEVGAFGTLFDAWKIRASDTAGKELMYETSSNLLTLNSVVESNQIFDLMIEELGSCEISSYQECGSVKFTFEIAIDGKSLKLIKSEVIS